MEPPKGKPERRASTGGRVLVILVLACSVLRFGVELVAIRTRCCYDFPAALEAVSSFTQGGPLYSRVLEDYAPGIGAFKYPPVYAVLLLPFSRLSTAARALDAYLQLELLLYLGAVLLLARAFRLDEPDRPGAGLAFAAIALNLGPVFETLLRLQIEIPILLALAFAALALAKGREGAAGAALAVAAALKLYPVLLLVPFVARRRSRVLESFAAVLLGLSLASLAVIGRAEYERFFLGALPVMLREMPTNLYLAENASLARWLMTSAGLEPAPARAFGSGIAMALLLVSLAALRGLRHGRPVSALETALFVPVMLLAMPNSWTNYQLLLIVPMAAVLGWCRGRTAREALLPLGLVLAAFLWMAYHMDTYYYPLGLHLPAELSALLHDNRCFASLLTWLAVLAARARGVNPLPPG